MAPQNPSAHLGTELASARGVIVEGRAGAASVNGFLAYSDRLRLRVDAVAQHPMDAVRFNFDPHPNGLETTRLDLRVSSGGRHLDVDISGGSAGESDDASTSMWTFDLVVRFGCPVDQVEDVVIELEWAELDPPHTVLTLTAAELREARRNAGDTTA